MLIGTKTKNGTPTNGTNGTNGSRERLLGVFIAAQEINQKNKNLGAKP